MNHSFIPSLIDKSLCQTCKYSLIAHGSEAQCESCPNVSNCELIESDGAHILMCESCAIRERQIQLELDQHRIAQQKAEGTTTTGNSSEERVTELVNRLSKELPLDARQFHVQEITSIVSIEQELRSYSVCDTNHASSRICERGTECCITLHSQEMTEDEQAFKLAEIVNDRLESFKKNLFELRKIEAELKVDMITDQRYLNLLVPSLRKEYREKFSQYDLTYTPATPIITPKVIKPRQSASEKALESLANLMGISVEEAKRKLDNATKNTLGIECICASAPGTCRVHPV